MAILLLYSILTFSLMLISFNAGDSLGYSRGLYKSTTTEYTNGLKDAMESCIESIINIANGKNAPLYEEDGEKTL